MLNNLHAMKMNGEHQWRVAIVMLIIAIAVIGGQRDVEFFNTIVDNSHVLGVTRELCNQQFRVVHRCMQKRHFGLCPQLFVLVVGARNVNVRNQPMPACPGARVAPKETSRLASLTLGARGLSF
jgi:hypothetical protein